MTGRCRNQSEARLIQRRVVHAHLTEAGQAHGEDGFPVIRACFDLGPVYRCPAFPTSADYASARGGGVFVVIPATCFAFLAASRFGYDFGGIRSNSIRDGVAVRFARDLIGSGRTPAVSSERRRLSKDPPKFRIVSEDRTRQDTLPTCLAGGTFIALDARLTIHFAQHAMGTCCGRRAG